MELKSGQLSAAGIGVEAYASRRCNWNGNGDAAWLWC